jgi:hypothetical protein
MPRCGFLNLQKLTLDRAHSGHETVEFSQKLPFFRTGALDKICGRAVADAMERVSQLPVQKPHVMLQIQEFLVKLGFLEHCRDLAQK